MSSPDQMGMLISARNQWLEDRPVMKEKNLDLPSLLQLLMGEAKEALDAVTEGDSKIFDQLKAVEQELADIGWFLLTAYKALEIKMNEALAAEDKPQIVDGSLMFKSMMEKHARNMAKYPAFLFDGSLTYNEATDLAKWDWKEIKGDHDFYNGTESAPIGKNMGEKLSPPPIREDLIPAGFSFYEGRIRSNKDIEKIKKVRQDLLKMSQKDTGIAAK